MANHRVTRGIRGGGVCRGGHLALGWAKCHALKHCMKWVDVN